MVLRLGRLTSLPSRVGALPSRVRALPKMAEGFYLSAAWRAYRSAHKAWTIRKLGGLWCTKCGSSHRLMLDHKHERKDGGADLPAYAECEWLCAPCHNAKTARAREARAKGGR